MGNLPNRFGELLVAMGFVTRSQVEEALALQPLTGARIGEALLNLGYLTRAQLQRALSAALRSGTEVQLDRPPLGEILIGLKYLDDENLEASLQRQKFDGRRLGELLVAEGVVTHQQVYEALGLQQRMARPADHVAPSAVDPSIHAAIKVMVVDDSALACNLVEEGLTRLGYGIHTFTDPFAALEQVDQVKPNVVLTDLDMPGLDGAELCKRLKDGPSRAVPVIILTANDADQLRVSGLRAGADDFVNKGVSMEELGARIDSILRRTNETERVRALFARYTSDAVVEEVLRAGDVVLSGEKRDVTVLFADIRDFTSISETFPPEQVMGVLNAALARMADAVLSEGGTLDKFLGDGVMAIFGAPARHEDDAARAVRAAVKMIEAVQEQNGSGEHTTPLELGIGINSGPVIAGSVGSARRTEYTVIGDAVNVAARFCSLAGRGEILLGPTTVEAMGEIDNCHAEALPAVKLKGKAQLVPVYRLNCDVKGARR